METDAIARTIEQYLREKFKIDSTDREFDADVHLFDYGYVDSFGAVDLTLFVESTFGITISNSDLVLYPLNTVNEIARFVVKRQKGEC